MIFFGSGRGVLARIGDDESIMNTSPRAPASQDALVRSAIAHWAPRFVAHGVSLTDFEEVTADIRTWKDWCRA